MTKSEQTTKHRVFEIIQIGNRSDTASRAFDYLIMTLIIANITAMFLDTFELTVVVEGKKYVLVVTDDYVETPTSTDLA